MPTPSLNDRRRSTEYFGQGQSGYTAGRIEGDHSLQIEARNESFPPGIDEHERERELGVDERFVGLGGVHWAPDPEDEQKGT